MISQEARIALETGNYILLTINNVNIVVDINTSLSTILYEYGDELDINDLLNATYKIVGE